ncbi:Uncharacterised protein [Bordetella pertussis]|nr:Uncharacterised protein [Bordetella pertussis]CFP63542.1 Uncharacterised protein [Bordetella pertussis]CPK35382.1 Uncharacterised protein [Bordetella pertussis]
MIIASTTPVRAPCTSLSSPPNPPDGYRVTLTLSPTFCFISSAKCRPATWYELVSPSAWPILIWMGSALAPNEAPASASAANRDFTTFMLRFLGK